MSTFIDNKVYSKENIDNFDSVSHRPIEEEYQFYDAVKNGDMIFVRKNVEDKKFTNPEGMGILSKNEVRNLRYHFVITTAMITRYCVDGGMELEKAYQLSDYYISQMDESNTIDEIALLHEKMVYDFTGKMSLLKNRKIISKSIIKCTDYIYKNIDNRILTAELAKYVGLSENYLSRLFAKELGISISDYIREKKIEKAVELLKYSDLSASDIAMKLSFSTQSHFIQTFKKYMGVSPKKYMSKISSE